MLSVLWQQAVSLAIAQRGGPVKTYRIAKTPLVVSRIAYGCMGIGGGWGVDPLDEKTRKEALVTVRAALDEGINFFDHADIYCNGEAEKIFGQVLKQVSGMRDRILIASKCGICRQGEPKPESPYRYDFSAGHIIWSCEQSLKRLGTDRIDLYQLHRPDYLCDPEEVATVFTRLHKAGKVRQFGVSNFRPSQLTALQKACPIPLIVNQVEISLAHLDAFHDGTLDQSMIENITPMAWSPLAGGRLVSTDPIDLRDPAHAKRLHLREALDLIGRDHQTTRPVIALAWLLKHPSRIVPIVGSTDPARVAELTSAVELDLSRDEWYRLLEAALGQRLP